MSYLSLRQFTSRFFNKNKDILLSYYPGLSESRLISELSYFAISHNLCDLDAKDSLYIPSSWHPIDRFFDDLLDGKPLEYINERSYFYKSSFYVNRSVLIPRSETEILCEQVVTHIKALKSQQKELSICDVGTGSGAILFSILADIEISKVRACAIDISHDALDVAKINFHRLGLKIPKQYKVSFVLNDRLDQHESHYDIIVSNPPYIKESHDLEKVHHQVLSYEPHLALFIEDKVYENWFDDFFNQVYDRLNDGGLFMMEGHEDHLEGQLKSIESIFDRAQIVKDYTGRNRFIKAYK